MRDDGEPGAGRGDRRPTGDPARLRVADVERPEPRGQGVPRRARRHADAQGRGRRRSRRSRASRPGSDARGARAAGGPRRAGWPALVDAQVPWGLDAALDPLARAAARGELAALPERESLERLAAAGVPVTPWRAVAADPTRRRRGVAGAGRRAGRAEARRARARPQDARRAAWRSGWPTRRRSATRSAACWRRRDGRGRASRAAGRADGAAGRRADRRRAARRACSGRRCWSGSAASSPRCSTTWRCCSRRSRPAEVVAPPRGPPRRRPAARRPRARPASTSTPSPRLVAAVGDLLVADPSIAEIDLNPVIASPGGVVAVDALVVLETARA